MLMFEEIKKRIELGTAKEREEAISKLSSIDCAEAVSLLRRVAEDPMEFRHLREMAYRGLGLRFPVPALSPIVHAESPNLLKSLKIDSEADYALYYVRVTCNGRRFYKVGITTSDLEGRYREDYSKIEKILYFERVVGALKAEQSILEKFKEHLFPLAVFKSGATEFFDKDVLGLDA